MQRALNGTPESFTAASQHVGSAQVIHTVDVRLSVQVDVRNDTTNGPLIARHSKFFRSVGERAIAIVVVEPIAPDVRQVDVRIAVVVEITNGSSLAVTFVTESRRYRHILKVFASNVAEETIRVAARWKRPFTPLRQIDVRPAIHIEVDNSDSASAEFEHPRNSRCGIGSVLEPKVERGSGCIVPEGNRGQLLASVVWSIVR